MKRIFLWAILLSLQLTLGAQSLSLLNGLSGMSPPSIDKLSENQIGQLVTEMNSRGVSVDALDAQGARYGLTPQSVARLKQRIVRYSSTQAERRAQQLPGTGQLGATGSPMDLLDENGEIRLPVEEEEVYILDRRTGKFVRKPQIFGLSTFRDANLTFEPNLRLATPVDYMLGPDDELLIDIYGSSEANYNLFVSPDGKINIPFVGVVTVGGLQMEEARSIIRQRLSSVYGGISNGSVKVSVALGDIRSITVSVIGEVASPGSYTIPSLSSVYNALYLSGGPTENASFRKVQVSRGSKVIGVIDLYDFLVYGKSSTLRLQDQDVIKVLPYQNRATITGEVKIPAIFEMNDFETVAHLIEFAGGFAQNAYKERITAYRNTQKERSVVDVSTESYASFSTENGDEFFVGMLIDRFTNRVQIQGAVYRPGEYALEEGMMASDLLAKADGLLYDAFTSRAVVYRKDALGRPEMASFSPAEVLEGRQNLLLQREDSVHVFSVTDMQEKEYVTVSGAVTAAATFPFAKGMTLKDALLIAGGFTSKVDSSEIIVFRQHIEHGAEIGQDYKEKAKQFTFSVDTRLGFGDEVSDFQLQKNDRITVRSLYGLEEMRRVSIVGEVKYPGSYVILNKEQRISDLLKMAGGVTEYAYPEGAFLIRKRNLNDAEKRMMQEIADQLTNAMGGSDETSKNDSLKQQRALIREFDLVGLNMDRILAQPYSRFDMLLSEGDSISIPQRLETVFVQGEVLQPNAIRYVKGKGFKRYLRESGGTSSKAWRKGSYVVHASGRVEGTRSFFGIRRYPNVLPGSRIMVPEKIERQRMSTGEVVSLSSSLVSVAAIIMTLFK